METNAYNVTKRNDKRSNHEEKSRDIQTKRQLQLKKRYSSTTIVARGLKRKKNKKRKSTPIGTIIKPTNKSSSPPAVARKFISGNRFLMNSKTSTFSPILNPDCGSISSSFKTPSRFKKRQGLVRRTHSPLTVVSSICIHIDLCNVLISIITS